VQKFQTNVQLLHLFCVHVELVHYIRTASSQTSLLLQLGPVCRKSWRKVPIK